MNNRKRFIIIERGYEKIEPQPKPKRQVFRPCFTKDELALTVEALENHIRFLETHYTDTFDSWNKRILCRNLHYNLKVLLKGEKRTGRRRNWFKPRWFWTE